MGVEDLAFVLPANKLKSGTGKLTLGLDRPRVQTPKADSTYTPFVVGPNPSKVGA